jgi:hypothetical protein
MYIHMYKANVIYLYCLNVDIQKKIILRIQMLTQTVDIHIIFISTKKKDKI